MDGCLLFGFNAIVECLLLSGVLSVRLPGVKVTSQSHLLAILSLGGLSWRGSVAISSPVQFVDPSDIVGIPFGEGVLVWAVCVRTFSPCVLSSYRCPL